MISGTEYPTLCMSDYRHHCYIPRAKTSMAGQPFFRILLTLSPPFGTVNPSSVYCQCCVSYLRFKEVSDCRMIMLSGIVLMQLWYKLRVSSATSWQISEGTSVSLFFDKSVGRNTVCLILPGDWVKVRLWHWFVLFIRWTLHTETCP